MTWAAPDLCDCAGCAEYRAVHDGLCRELPLSVRLAKRDRDRAALRRYEDACALRTPMLPRAV